MCLDSRGNLWQALPDQQRRGVAASRPRSLLRVPRARRARGRPAHPTMECKLRLRGDTRLATLPRATLAIAVAVAADTFGVPAALVKLGAADGDGDVVTLVSDADLERCVDAQRTRGRAVPLLDVVVPADVAVATVNPAAGAGAAAAAAREGDADGAERKRRVGACAIHRWSDAGAVVFMRVANIFNGAALAAGAVGSFFMPGSETIGLARFILAGYLTCVGGVYLRVPATRRSPLRPPLTSSPPLAPLSRRVASSA
jgi:hypothetical protein